VSNRIVKFIAILSVVCAIGACGGGSHLVSNRGGRVESGELDLGKIPLRPEPKEYVINYGDGLDVLFLYNSELNQIDLKVRPDGKISLPYVGDVEAAGSPVSALDSLLTSRFSEIIVSPSVTVVVRSYRPQVVYAMGDVSTPGGYEFHPGMTLTDFLALSGGPSKTGKRNAILVIRRVASDHIVGIQIDLNELIGKKRFDLDIPLQAFDVVYVPRSALVRAQDFMLAVKDILSPPVDLYLKGWQIANQKVLFDFYRRQGNSPF
jgi:polysaccharide export outer membrane protein